MLEIKRFIYGGIRNVYTSTFIILCSYNDNDFLTNVVLTLEKSISATATISM